MAKGFKGLSLKKPAPMTKMPKVPSIKKTAAAPIKKAGAVPSINKGKNFGKKDPMAY